MQISINEEVAQQVQSFTSIKLRNQDFDFLAEWLLKVGIETIKRGLEMYPEITLGDLLKERFHNSATH
jgi:hypothetical protein